MAAGSTYTPIATTTLGSAQATVTFSSISGSYTDLILVMSVKNSLGSYYDNLLQFNGDTGSNYSWTRLRGNGTTADSTRGSNQTSIQVGWGGADYVPNIVQIQNYSNATTYKSVLSRQNDAAANVAAYVGLWRNTAAINQITINAYSGSNLSSGSTFTLYGITAA